MRKTYSPEEWATIGKIINATIELQNRLEEKGYKVINTFATRADNDSIVFIVNSGCYSECSCVKNLEVCIFNVLNHQDLLEKAIFAPAEELLKIAPEQAEKDALKKRLAELENNG